jgi:hypothetical protein
MPYGGGPGRPVVNWTDGTVEKRHLQTVGCRYALRDDLKAQIAEARARQNRHRQEARDQIRKARSQGKVRVPFFPR